MRQSKALSSRMKCTRMPWLWTMSSLELMTLSYHFPAAIPEIPYRVLDSRLRVFSLGMKVMQDLFFKKKISVLVFNLYFPIVFLLSYRHLTILPLRLRFSFCFDWKDISKTRDSVSSAIQTPRISSEILRCASYFQFSSRCLDILKKHCLLCLIY